MRAPACQALVSDDLYGLRSDLATYSVRPCNRGLHARLYVLSGGPVGEPTRSSSFTRSIGWHLRPDGLIVLRILSVRASFTTLADVQIECATSHPYPLKHHEIIELY